MEFQIAGRTFELRAEPLTEDVEKVIEYDQEIIFSAVDLENLSDEDRQKDVTVLLTQNLLKNPARMKKYLAQQKIMEPVKTIMLVTGLSPKELREIPLLSLYLKCKEVLGGNASDFFGKLDMTMPIPMMQMKAKKEQEE